MTRQKGPSQALQQRFRGHTAVMRHVMLRLQAARTALLSTAGFGTLTAAAWTAWGTAPGLAAGGVSFLLLEYLSSTPSKESRS